MPNPYKGNTFFLTEISYPVAGEHAFYGDIIPIGLGYVFVTSLIFTGLLSTLR